MDVVDGLATLDYVSSVVGQVLSVEQRSALQSSLYLVKQNYKFSSVIFWGKINGVEGDYYVVQGWGKNLLDLSARKTLYSADCVEWAQLPQLDADAVPVIAQLTGRFYGKASFEYRLPLPPGVQPPPSLTKPKAYDADGNTIIDEDEDDLTMDGSDGGGGGGGDGAGGSGAPRQRVYTARITEEKRLSYVVGAIDQENAVVPRGAFLKTAQDIVRKNPSFEGLSETSAKDFSSYVHFRPAVLLYKKTLLDREPLDNTLDFLDAIDEDVPKGTWAMRTDPSIGLVTLQSLLWPGFVCCHLANTPRFGYAYFGLGERNMDLPFML